MGLEQSLNAWIDQQVADGKFFRGDVTGVQDNTKSGNIKVLIGNDLNSTVKEEMWYVVYSGTTDDYSDLSFRKYVYENYSG